MEALAAHVAASHARQLQEWFAARALLGPSKRLAQWNAQELTALSGPSPSNFTNSDLVATKLGALATAVAALQAEADDLCRSEADEQVILRLRDEASHLQQQLLEEDPKLLARQSRKLHVKLLQQLTKLQASFSSAPQVDGSGSEAPTDIPRNDVDLETASCDSDSDEESVQQALELSGEQTNAVECSKSIFIQGRSGTGKTLVLVRRIARRHAQVLETTGGVPSQLYVTKSSLLRDQVACELTECLSNTQWPPHGVLCATWEQLVQLRGGRAAVIGYDRFLESYWPRLRSYARSLSPLLVWAEFNTRLRPFKCAVGNGSALSLRDYLKDDQAAVGIRLEESDAHALYFMFREYTEMKSISEEFDDVDVALALRASSSQGGEGVEYLYIDEAQDFAPAELVAMLSLCHNVEGVTVAGDTCQTINPGSAFNFADIMEAFARLHPAAHKRASFSMLTLTLNYRCAPGVVNLANSVTDLLMQRFPRCADRIEEATASEKGAQPIFVQWPGQDPATCIIGAGSSTLPKAEAARLTILVRTHEDRQALLKSGVSGTILTVAEAKGLEFDFVIVCGLLSHLPDSVVCALADEASSETQLAKTHDQGSCQRLAGAAHSLLCRVIFAIPEFKTLYVAITRARKGSVVLECGSRPERWAPLLKLWQNQGLVEVWAGRQGFLKGLNLQQEDATSKKASEDQAYLQVQAELATTEEETAPGSSKAADVELVGASSSSSPSVAPGAQGEVAEDQPTHADVNDDVAVVAAAAATPADAKTEGGEEGEEEEGSAAVQGDEAHASGLTSEDMIAWIKAEMKNRYMNRSKLSKGRKRQDDTQVDLLRSELARLEAGGACDPDFGQGKEVADSLEAKAWIGSNGLDCNTREGMISWLQTQASSVTRPEDRPIRRKIEAELRRLQYSTAKMNKDFCKAITLELQVTRLVERPSSNVFRRAGQQDNVEASILLRVPRPIRKEPEIPSFVPTLLHRFGAAQDASMPIKDLQSNGRRLLAHAYDNPRERWQIFAVAHRSFVQGLAVATAGLAMQTGLAGRSIGSILPSASDEETTWRRQFSCIVQEATRETRPGQSQRSSTAVLTKLSLWCHIFTYLAPAGSDVWNAGHIIVEKTWEYAHIKRELQQDAVRAKAAFLMESSTHNAAALGKEDKAQTKLVTKLTTVDEKQTRAEELLSIVSTNWYDIRRRVVQIGDTLGTLFKGGPEQAKWDSTKAKYQVFDPDRLSPENFAPVPEIAVLEVLECNKVAKAACKEIRKRVGVTRYNQIQIPVDIALHQVEESCKVSAESLEEAKELRVSSEELLKELPNGVLEIQKLLKARSGLLAEAMRAFVSLGDAAAAAEAAQRIASVEESLLKLPNRILAEVSRSDSSGVQRIAALWRQVQSEHRVSEAMRSAQGRARDAELLAGSLLLSVMPADHSSCKSPSLSSALVSLRRADPRLAQLTSPSKSKSLDKLTLIALSWSLFGTTPWPATPFHKPL